MGNYLDKRVREHVERTERDRLPPWTPFVRATKQWHAGGLTREQHIDEMLKVFPELSREQVAASLDALKDDEIWVNSRYQVNIVRQAPDGDPDGPRLVHLSIKRRDKDVPHEERWRDFQRIKNELVGPECEAVELYPAESRVVDTANQFHLWAFESPEVRVPFGFDSGARRSDVSPVGGKQRPFDEE